MPSNPPQCFENPSSPAPEVTIFGAPVPNFLQGFPSENAFLGVFGLTNFGQPWGLGDSYLNNLGDVNLSQGPQYETIPKWSQICVNPLLNHGKSLLNHGESEY